MKTSAFNHHVAAITPKDFNEMGAYTRQYLAEGCKSAKNCRKPITHRTSYNYITGAKGRASYSERYCCAEHASKFAAKYDVPLPAVDFTIEVKQ